MQNGKLYTSIIENDKLIWYLDNTTVYKTSDIAELVLIKGGEKMYTMEECKKLCIKAYKNGQNNPDSYYGRADQIINNEWFEQNVK